MATDVIMPALGMAQETGKLLRWLKADGDTIVKGEPLMEVETDKVTVEVEAPADGRLAAIRAAEGEDVQVGSTVALILAVGEEAPAASEAAARRCRRRHGGSRPSSGSTSPRCRAPGRAERSSPRTSPRSAPSRPRGPRSRARARSGA